VATGSVEKGKNVGRPPVNEEILEDLRPHICRTQIETRLHPIKVGVWIAASRTRLIAFIVKIKEPVLNEVT
jgi:hypothetical protein